MTELSQPLVDLKLPRFIAICGNPKSGKSEVQKILQEIYGYQPVDDGRVIRRFAIDWLGLTENDVYSQEGKARYVEILGKRWQIRDILGTYGKKLEEMFGKWIMPYLGTRNLPEGGLYSFGSCRRDQGLFYKSLGGVVFEVKNPLAGPSPYDFDQYDASIVDVTIENDGLSRFEDKVEARKDLEAKVMRAVLQVAETVR